MYIICVLEIRARLSKIISVIPVADLEICKGVQRGQLNRRGFTTPVNCNVRLLTETKQKKCLLNSYEYTHVVDRRRV